jgi:hypothetical protein
MADILILTFAGFRADIEKRVPETRCSCTASKRSSDDMLKEASGGYPGPVRIEVSFWKID